MGFKTWATALKRSMLRLCISLIQLYRWCISPILQKRCRFYPTCSAYSIEALSTHGLMKGGYLTLYRLLRCHPWGGSGVDLVPEHQQRQKNGPYPLTERDGHPAKYLSSRTAVDRTPLTGTRFPTNIKIAKTATNRKEGHSLWMDKRNATCC